LIICFVLSCVSLPTSVLENGTVRQLLFVHPSCDQLVLTPPLSFSLDDTRILVSLSLFLYYGTDLGMAVHLQENSYQRLSPKQGDKMHIRVTVK
jgi:hypothetical protein